MPQTLPTVQIDSIGSLFTAVRQIQLDLYMQPDPTPLINLIAQVTPPYGPGFSGTLEWIDAFPELRDWVGEREAQKAFAGNLKYELSKKEVTFEMGRSRFDLGDPLQAAFVLSLAQKIVAAIRRGKVDRAIELLSTNPPSYDNQNLLDANHVHPNGEPYSNWMTVDTADIAARTTLATPSMLELNDELKRVEARLRLNRLYKRSTSRVDRLGNLTVVVRNDNIERSFADLLTEPDLAPNVRNPWQGKFSLLRAPDGVATRYEVISSEPGGPRPVILVEGPGPYGTVTSLNKVFSHDVVEYGDHLYLSAIPAFPQTVVTVSEVAP